MKPLRGVIACSGHFGGEPHPRTSATTGYKHKPIPTRSETLTETIQVGSAVPDFTLNTYEPSSGDFDEVSLADLKSSGKWTILFFYPADFTFV